MKRSLVLIFLFGSSTLPASGATLRVPADFPTIQEAIDAAVDGDRVLLADGVHAGPGNRDLEYRGKAIEVTSDNGPEATVIDCQGEGQGFAFRQGETRRSVLSRITVRNGMAERGGAISCESSSPTLRECIFESNSADLGGGLYVETRIFAVCGGSPRVESCAFEGNYAGFGGGFFAAGRRASPRLVNCRFSGNLAEIYGGGVYWAGGCSPAFLSCSLVQNQSLMIGGGVFCGYGDPQAVLRDCLIEGNCCPAVFCFGPAQFENCIIRGNEGVVDCIDSSITFRNCLIVGSGNFAPALIFESSTANLIHCTISGNQAPPGYALLGFFETSAALKNCIVWGNNAEPLLDGEASTVEFSHSILQGSPPQPGPGNLNADPLFSAPGVFDFQRFATRTAGGREFSVPDFIIDPGDYHLEPGSPARDGGDAASAVPIDADGNGRPCGPGVDLGAYEEGDCLASLPPALRILPAEVDIGYWGTELVEVTVRDGFGEPISGIEVSFESRDQAQAWFPYPRATTNTEGVAYNVIFGDRFRDPDELETSFFVCVPGQDLVEVPVQGRFFIADGPIEFDAPPLELFQTNRQTLVGGACGFVSEMDVGFHVRAWSIDPTVAEIEDGRITAVSNGCARMEFTVIAHRDGEARFVIGTVDLSLYVSQVEFVQYFRRGDTNNNMRFDITDAINTLNHLFLGFGGYQCEDAADSNDTGFVDISDPVYSLSFLFLGGPPPPSPGPSVCGFDPTPDELHCDSFTTCDQ